MVSLVETFKGQVFIRNILEKNDSKDLQVVKNSFMVHYAE